MLHTTYSAKHRSSDRPPTTPPLALASITCILKETSREAKKTSTIESVYQREHRSLTRTQNPKGLRLDDSGVCQFETTRASDRG